MEKQPEYRWLPTERPVKERKLERYIILWRTNKYGELEYVGPPVKGAPK
jgi:hypothetical protein